MSNGGNDDDGESTLLPEVKTSADIELMRNGIGAYPELIVRAWTDAFNKRDLDVRNPIWKHIHPNFRSVPDSPESPRKPVTLQAYLEHIRRFQEAFPDSRVEYDDMQTSFKGRRREEAVVFGNFRIVNAPVGIVRHRIIWFIFRYLQGEGEGEGEGEIEQSWMCSTWEIADGLGRI